MSDYNELDYPNLASCRVKLTGSAASSRPPVSLPDDCLQAANMTLPGSPYAFSLERDVLKRKEDTTTNGNA
eukprot:scaffold13517_cov49-Cylindrotheca_fusiformis.AAC.1